MNRIVYSDKIGGLPQNVSLTLFINAVEPFVKQNFELSGEWRETYIYTGHDGIVTSRESILGDENGAYLKHSVYESTVSDGYSGDGGIESFRSYGLSHKTTSEKLEISICINRLLFTNDEIEFHFEGEEGDVEKLKEYVKSGLRIHL